MKPVILIGNGVRNAPHIIETLTKLQVPVLTTWQGCDLLPEDSPVFCGRPGSVGQRAANIIIQKADWLMIVGARLDMETVGYNLEGFAPNCTQPLVVDCDEAELSKFPDHWGKLMMDFNDPKLKSNDGGLPFVSNVDNPGWLAWCKALYARFRPELESMESGNYVDPYAFMAVLSDACQESDVLVPGSSGVQSGAFFQSFKVKRGQRILCCNTIGSMGFEPMAIGAAISSGRRVIVVTGDGGFAQNMQELEVVKRLNLPIHYFVFSNGGYSSVVTMQDTRFGLRVGADPKSGFTVPDLMDVATMFDFRFMDIHNNRELWKIQESFQGIRPIVRVHTSTDFRYAGKVQSKMTGNVLTPDPMQDMSPHLPAGELERLMNE